MWSSCDREAAEQLIMLHNQAAVVGAFPTPPPPPPLPSVSSETLRALVHTPSTSCRTAIVVNDTDIDVDGVEFVQTVAAAPEKKTRTKSTCGTVAIVCAFDAAVL